MSTKSPLLRERLKEVTAQEILTAAESELAERGLAATAMSAIANRAGVSVGTLYNYFQDKDALLTQLLTDRRQRFASLLTEAISAHAALPFEAQLEGVVGEVFDIFERHRSYLRIVFEHDTAPSLKDDDAKSPAMHFIDRLRPLAMKGVESGHLDASDADLYASALASLMRGVMLERLADPKRSFREATPFILRMFLNGAKKRS